LTLFQTANETLIVSACGNMVEKYTCIKIIETVVEESVEIITSIAHASCSVFLTSSFVSMIKRQKYPCHHALSLCKIYSLWTPSIKSVVWLRKSWGSNFDVYFGSLKMKVKGIMHHLH